MSKLICPMLSIWLYAFSLLLILKRTKKKKKKSWGVSSSDKAGVSLQQLKVDLCLGSER